MSVFIHFDPTLSDLNISLSQYGFSPGDVVTITAVGGFSAEAAVGGPFHEDKYVHFRSRYNGLTQNFGETNRLNAYLLNSGTNISLLNNDTPLDDNSDPNGDYGIIVDTVSLFGNGSDDVNFNSLTTDKKVAAAAFVQAADSSLNVYTGVGGNGVVTLPNTGMYHQYLGWFNGTNVFLDWNSNHEFNIGSLSGQAGTTRGGDGNDIIHGGDGNDTVVGSPGGDNLKGGLGDDTFDYSYGISSFAANTIQTIDGGADTRPTTGFSTIKGDIIKLPGSPSDYRFATTLGTDWATTHTIIIDSDNGAAFDTQDVELAIFGQIDNPVTLSSSSLLAEMAALSEASYLDPLTGYNDALARGWHPVSAIELGVKPSNFGLGDFDFDYDFIPAQVDGHFHARNPGLFGLRPHSDALILTGTVGGAKTLTIAFRGTDEGREEIPNYLSMTGTLEKFFAPLLEGIKTYVVNNAIDQVLLTGHSLGSSMVQAFLQQDFAQGGKFKGFGFASPGAEPYILSTSPAADQIVNFIHTSDPIRFATKDVVGPEIWINSVLDPKAARYGSSGYHNVNMYIDNLQLLLQFAKEAGPFSESPLAHALLDGSIASFPSSFQLAPGTSANDKITSSRKEDFALGGGGKDDFQIASSDLVAAAASGRRIIDGGADKDRVVLGGDKAVFDYAQSAIDGRLGWKLDYKLAGKEVAWLYQVEQLVFVPTNQTIDLHGSASLADSDAFAAVDAAASDYVVNLDGTPVAVQTVALGATTLTADHSFDYIDTGSADVEVTASGLGDIIAIGSGHAKVLAAGGNNIIFVKDAAASADLVITLSAGDNVVNTGNGNDVISAGTGNDQVHGGVGSDILAGRDGNDTLDDGGADAATVRDVMYGGVGNDTYHVTSTLTSALDIVDEGEGNPTLPGAASDSDTIISHGEFFWDFYSVAERLEIAPDANVAFPNGTHMIGGKNTDSAIFGNDGVNLISAYGGSHVVDAGGGTDAISFSLYGLPQNFDGVNTLSMRPGTGIDYLYDFTSNVDKVDLRPFNFGISGQAVLDQAVNVDPNGVTNSGDEYCYFFLTNAGGVNNFVAFVGLTSAQLHAGDFIMA